MRVVDEKRYREMIDRCLNCPLPDCTSTCDMHEDGKSSGPARRTIPAPDNLGDMVRYGLTAKRIAAYCHVSQSTAQRWVREYKQKEAAPEKYTQKAAKK